MIDWAARRLRPQDHIAQKAWRNRSDDQKYLAAMRALERLGAKAFSLNLAPHVEASASDKTCISPTVFLGHRINRALRAEGLAGLPFCFVLEVSPQGRLHLHGAILTAGVDLAAVKRALLAAAGAPRVEPAKRARLLSLKPFSIVKGAEGWVGYTSKPSPAVACKRRIFVSTPANRLAREFCAEWQAYVAPKPMHVAAEVQVPVEVQVPADPIEDALAALSLEDRARYEAEIAELDAALAAPVPVEDAATDATSAAPMPQGLTERPQDGQLAPSGQPSQSKHIPAVLGHFSGVFYRSPGAARERPARWLRGEALSPEA